jgi:hypothetical protein
MWILQGVGSGRIISVWLLKIVPWLVLNAVIFSSQNITLLGHKSNPFFI